MRLEESLPVLVRGKRVVIAGDPKQLPPTRFFESAFAASDEDDSETDQQIFEQQQGEVEDLLGAALGLDIQQCYLDVHYRSRHADLIAFSNRYFYGSRLQPIPSRPSADSLAEPSVQLEQVGGVYERRRNPAEADRIVQIVRELLAKPEPPSIGIACFNLSQRDLVADKLDEAAGADAEFGKRLESARSRQGAGSFEGLFVKNLENVQGDERDYILVSTTYGPDRAGKFFRRFGPLGRVGGGRRLNVLVTRAREKVHVLTSIPAAEYATLPELEPGQAPGGMWLLFAYLKFASELAKPAAANPSSAAPSSAATPSPALAPLAMPGSALTLAPTVALAPMLAAGSATPPGVNVLPTASPSGFAISLARRLASDHQVGSDVFWGNEGFCIDVALRATGSAPDSAPDSSIGVMCDAARFAAADDPIQWDIFRTGILESQGWNLHRVWTPHFFRDPRGAVRDLLAKAAPREKPAVSNKT